MSEKKETETKVDTTKISENDIGLNEQSLHDKIDELREWHDHIDSNLVADILDLIVNDLYSLNLKFNKK